MVIVAPFYLSHVYIVSNTLLKSKKLESDELYAFLVVPGCLCKFLGASVSAIRFSISAINFAIFAACFVIFEASFGSYSPHSFA